MFAPFQPLAAIATTPAAIQTLRPFCAASGATLYVPLSLASSPQTVPYPGSLHDHLAALWPRQRAFVFGLATGAVVRAIAPLLRDKASDPAIVVVDARGQHAISLCSGHQGGADRLAQLVASLIGATPVLTGAAASASQLPVDTLGAPFGWQRGAGDWTGVSAVAARGERLEVLQEVGSTLWQAHLPPDHSFAFDTNGPPAGRLWISFTARHHNPTAAIPKAQWHPRVLWIGVGCERGTSRQLLETSLAQLLQQHHLAPEAIAGLATLDRKADELALCELSAARQWPLVDFTPAELQAVTVPNPSATVEQAVGTPSVAEAAALRAAGHREAGRHLLVSKQIYRQPDQPGAATLAIALAEQEYTGRSGQLWLVGTGPGALEQMTLAARTAIQQADAVIGYALYLQAIAPLRRPGQIVEAWPIAQERERAQRAIELARWGLTVAVVSSGDCGIYGMAGLVLETLQASGWDGSKPAVEVFPGVSALQAVAARVGAPLMHDFCAISLSDLLTPWATIEQRLVAAATADFVTALYNPRSQRRTEQIVAAQRIFLQHRAPETPVTIARAVYRPEEQIIRTTLGEMLEHSIDMLSTAIIGNRSTRQWQDWLITPRGYAVESREP